MVLTKKQRKEFDKLADKVVKWLNQNCHPHVTVVITTDRAEMLEGVCSTPITKYLRD